MIRFAALGASVLLLGGCALPVPVQIASWVLDGISYIATEKSVADHGLSLVADKDCAVLRGLLNEGEFCRDFEDQTTVFAGIGSEEPDIYFRKGLVPDGGTEVASLGDIESLANFETASGGPSGGEEAEAGVLIGGGAEMAWPLDMPDSIGLPGYPWEITVKEEKYPEPSPGQSGNNEFSFSFRAAIDEWQNHSLGLVKKVALHTSKPTAKMESRVENKIEAKASEPTAGLYFVIGSFRQHENARNLRRQFQALTPSVLSAKLERGTVFRVVVGPFGQRDAKKVHKAIFKAGIADSWAIRVEPGQWSMAMVDPPALKASTVPLVAGLSRQKQPLSTFELIQQLAALVY